MKGLVEAASSLLPALEQKGVVFLFALFERDDVPGKWDIVLSSEWSDRDTAGGVRFVSQEIVPLLKPDDLAALARIVVVPSSEPSVHAMSSAVTVLGGRMEVRDSNFMGLPIKHAFIFRSRRPSNLPAAVGTSA